eukprot:269097-Chlamydomonas_euryale.AAC.5
MWVRSASRRKSACCCFSAGKRDSIVCAKEEGAHRGLRIREMRGTADRGQTWGLRSGPSAAASRQAGRTASSAAGEVFRGLSIWERRGKAERGEEFGSGSGCL